MKTIVKPFISLLVPQAIRRKRWAKQRIRRYQQLRWRVLSGPVRSLPDFIIIGAQRCGTTSLYHYLTEHPHIVPAVRKEVHFFDNYFEEGIIWYRAHFPSLLYKWYVKRLYQYDILTGEASPYYIIHPWAPWRISKILPHVKLIVLLRNPVDRAYSHYQHTIRLKKQTLSFEEAITRESEILAGEREQMLQNEQYYSSKYRIFSYLSRGIYVKYLKVWYRFFPSEQILILRSEDFYASPATSLKKVFTFLNLPDRELQEYKPYNHITYPEMASKTRKQLIEYFQPYNQQLYGFLKRDFFWDR